MFRGSTPGVGKISRTRPDRPRDLPNFLYNGYGVSFLGENGRVVALTTHPPSSAELEEKVQLYVCSPTGPPWPVLG